MTSCNWHRCDDRLCKNILLPITTRHMTSYNTKLWKIIYLEHYSNQFVKSMNQKRIINYSRAVKTQEAKMNQYYGKTFFFFSGLWKIKLNAWDFALEFLNSLTVHLIYLSICQCLIVESVWRYRKKKLNCEINSIL